MRHSIRIFIIISVLISTSDVLAQKKDNFQWLLGVWKIITTNGITIEQWKSVNDSTYSGKSYFVKTSGDTIPQEFVELHFRKGQWMYVPTEHGQNKNQPTVFQVIFIGTEEFISTNSAHDFPQRIAYRRVKNQLLASIEGSRKGKYAKQNFDFKME